MTGAPLRNIGASVRARLLRRSRESGEDFQILLRRYAAERFLYRLGESPHRERYVLKGAMLLAIWGGSVYRPTRDIDFTGYGSSRADDVRSTIRDICALPVPDDGIVFDGEEIAIESIRQHGEYDSLRVRFEARLAGARIRMQIDIGFGNAIEPPPVDTDYSALLNAPRPRIRVYPPEAVVAEKLHAMVTLGERNSRFKDFHDVYILSQHLSFDGGRLTSAVSATFQRRGTAVTQALPVALTPRFYADPHRAFVFG